MCTIYLQQVPIYTHDGESAKFSTNSQETDNSVHHNFDGDGHRVVLSFLSTRRNWDTPTPPAAGECAPPPFGPGGGAHSFVGEGLGESQFRRGDIQYTVVLNIYKYFVVMVIYRGCITVAVILTRYLGKETKIILSCYSILL
jgi:hypothetical protein